MLESSVDEVTGEYVVVSERVRELSRAELSGRATKIARELDPDSAEASAARARDARRVVIQPDRHQPGMARWVVHLPTETSQRMAAAVDALAGEYARANPGTPIDAARADALTDLVLSSADVSTVVELLVPVLPATAELVPAAAGLGPMTAELGPETAELVPTPAELLPASADLVRDPADTVDAADPADPAEDVGRSARTGCSLGHPRRRRRPTARGTRP